MNLKEIHEIENRINELFLEFEMARKRKDYEDMEQIRWMIYELQDQLDDIMETL